MTILRNWFRLAGLVSLAMAASQALAGIATDSPPLKIIAANYPLAYFAERIGGSRVSVKLPMPADEDPAYWKPNAKAVGEMQRAELILLNGADFEKWLPKVSLSKFKLADTAISFKDNWIRIENAVTHSHGAGGMHSHDGTAFTTWLDFTQAARQADAAGQAIVRKRPELKAVTTENLQSLQEDLARLDKQMQSVAASKPGMPLLASHPVYQYLARRYGLNLHSVHWEPSEMPPESEWENLRQQLQSHPARWMIWEAEPDAAIANRLAVLGVRSLVFAPCANQPESGDFLEIMTGNITRLQQAYRE